MSTSKFPILISPQTLSRHLDDQSVQLIYVGSLEKYLEGHIQGAVHLTHASLNLGVAPKAGFLPDTDHLQQLFRAIGLNHDSQVICHDDEAGTAAARLFWVLEALGHQNVSFLDGGLLAWQAAGFSLTTVVSTVQTGNWSAAPQPQVLATKQYVLDSLSNPKIQILDARSEQEHLGIKSAAERKGHIPGAVSMNWLNTRDTNSNNQLKPLEELQQNLNQLGLDQSKEIIAHCQTHQRSCHSYMMLRALGYEKIRGFAGSWSEWSADSKMPVINLQETSS